VMGRGVAKLILNKKIVSAITKKILLRYFRSLSNNSAQELLAQTNCIIKITPQKITVWEF
ncbi:MAG: pyridoxamine 5'-phosphate oxidase family protein, partial [Nitrosopumilaceae archaeon]